MIDTIVTLSGGALDNQKVRLIVQETSAKAWDQGGLVGSWELPTPPIPHRDGYVLTLDGAQVMALACAECNQRKARYGN